MSSSIPKISATQTDLKIADIAILKKSVLEKMTKAYKKTVDPNETTSCMLSITQLEYLIKYYSQTSNLNSNKKIDGFRFYFFREDLHKVFPYPNQHIQQLENGLSQISIVAVPVWNFKIDNDGKTSTAFADDMFNENDECLVAMPGGEHTGLCPTNCPR